MNGSTFLEGGGRILSFYKNSPAVALQQIYPEYSWHPWLFNQTPKFYWNTIENRRYDNHRTLRVEGKGQRAKSGEE